MMAVALPRFYVGMRVIVRAGWSNFDGWLGVVVEVHDGWARVRLDDDDCALRFAFCELAEAPS